jgi:hypothetical protein
LRAKPYPPLEGFKTIIKDASDRVPAAITANPIENRGALIRDHKSRELKNGTKKILTGMSVPPDLPAVSRPDSLSASG